MAKLLQLREMAEQMGLQGQEAVAFALEQQEIGKEERRLQQEHQREAEAAARAHELEVIRLRGEAPVNPDRNIVRGRKRSNR